MGRSIRRWQCFDLDEWLATALSDQLLKTISTLRLLKVYRKARRLAIFYDSNGLDKDQKAKALLSRYKEELAKREHILRE